ncbi:organic solvent tolerance protein [Sphingomonas sp. Leaf33]|uniref:LPS-assembly protein LptD n=1 Tax=Sphingomonas sp. Leaf33 TaxID=1736215 RepID=UPI000702094F|nr:LPS assembly protein LptD [Sphingomonas sp. Leaf33]KQN26250.1 organic solvent tolerance protein [Sphingomonas sp. Leaf33]
MKRPALLSTGALAFALSAFPAGAQDLQDRVVSAPPPSETALPASDDQVQFSADTLEYQFEDDVVTAKGDVRMFRQADRLRADTVTWNRKTGQVIANGNIAVTNPGGDVAYGDRIELTDSLKDGVIENMLVVLEQGGRIAARRGSREDGGVIVVEDAAYTPCSVTNSAGCPQEPVWKITAVRVVYDPDAGRIKYKGARLSLFGLPTIPLPTFSHPIGGRPASGLLLPDIRLGRVNGLEIGLPYLFKIDQSRDLIVTPRIFTATVPMLSAEYRELNSLGAFRIAGWATSSRRSDDPGISGVTGTSEYAFRGYLDSSGRLQLSPNWSVSESIRLVTDKTFLRRYDISRDDRLRSTVRVERIDPDSYFSIAGWSTQTMRLTENQSLQPIALPEIDYRRRIGGLFGGQALLQLNTLALTRPEGQDTQRAFASLRWDLRRLTRWGQEVTFTAFARGDLYNTRDVLATTVASYRGEEGFSTRAIGALAVDVRWPLIGNFLGGTQRLTPRAQIVASPKIANLSIPNEDARAVELEDSNLFALNRFPGYDRFEDTARITYGADYALDLPGLSVEANIGQSYRLSQRPSILPDGTGLSDRFSDYIGRTTVRFRDFVSLIHRYRVDKDGFAVRRNEVDATIGTRSTYALLGYLRLNRNIDASLEDLQDREEARVGGRVQVARFWSVFGSATMDLTDRAEDPLSQSDGFDPVRHRLGVTYEDDCLRLGVTWRRDYQDRGDARRGNSYLLTLSFKNLGR